MTRLGCHLGVTAALAGAIVAGGCRGNGGSGSGGGGGAPRVKTAPRSLAPVAASGSILVRQGGRQQLAPAIAYSGTTLAVAFVERPFGAPADSAGVLRIALGRDGRATEGELSTVTIDTVATIGANKLVGLPGGFALRWCGTRPGDPHHRCWLGRFDLEGKVIEAPASLGDGLACDIAQHDGTIAAACRDDSGWTLKLVPPGGDRREITGASACAYPGMPAIDWNGTAFEAVVPCGQSASGAFERVLLAADGSSLGPPQALVLPGDGPTANGAAGVAIVGEPDRLWILFLAASTELPPTQSLQLAAFDAAGDAVVRPVTIGVPTPGSLQSRGMQMVRTDNGTGHLLIAHHHHQLIAEGFSAVMSVARVDPAQPSQQEYRQLEGTNLRVPNAAIAADGASGTVAFTVSAGPWVEGGLALGTVDEVLAATDRAPRLVSGPLLANPPSAVSCAATTCWVLAEEYVHAHVTLARQLRWIRVDRGGGPPMPAARAFAIPGDRLVELEPGPRGAVLWWSAGLGYNLATFAFDGAFSPIDRLWLGAARIAHATAGEGEMRLVLDEPRDRITAATVPELQAAPAPLVTPGMLGGRPAVCGNDYYAYVRGVTDGDGDGINDTHLTRYRWGCPEGFVAMPGAAANTSGDLVCSDSQVVTVAFRPSPSAPDTYERLVASYARDGRPLGRYVLADSRLLATAHLAGHVFVLFDAPEPAQPFLFYDLSEDGAATTYPLSRPGGTGRLSPDRLWTQTANLEVDDREIRLAWPDDAGNIHLSFWSRP